MCHELTLLIPGLENKLRDELEGSTLDQKIEDTVGEIDLRKRCGYVFINVYIDYNIIKTNGVEERLREYA